MRPIILAGGLAPALLLLTGCGGDNTPPPPSAGWVPDTLRLAEHSDFRSLDPAVANDTNLIPTVRMIFQPLLDYDDGVNLVPLAAEALPALSADGKTYTFKLRKDVHFSNGRRVTAADYIYAWQRILDPATKSSGVDFIKTKIAGAQEYRDWKGEENSRKSGQPPDETIVCADSVSGLNAPDPYTLEVTLTHPDLTFPFVAAMTYLAAVPQEEVEKPNIKEADWNDEFALHPVGDGPFVLKDWRRGLRLRLERDPHYWGPNPPALQAIEIQFGLDDLTMEMMFERGELDLLDRVPPPAYARLRKDPRWQACFASLVFNGEYFINLNCEMEPFTGPNGKKLRQALNYAVNKKRLEQIGNGRFIAATGVVPPNMPGYHSRVAGYPYDPEQARALLAEAGYPNGLPHPLTLWMSNERSEWIGLMQSVQEDLKRVGVQVELNPVNYDTFLPTSSKRGATVMSHSGWFQDYPDPSDFLNLFRSEAISDVESNNMAFYSNEESDKLMEAGAGETDPEKRARIYEHAEEVVMDDAPVIPLLYGVEVWMHQRWVHNHKIHPVWLVTYERLSISPP
jgi:ABC-type transport system substrate-binding protein